MHILQSNILKKKLREGAVSLGTFISIGNPDIVDILKGLGFEWFVFDMEHSYLSFETVKVMQQAMSDSSACPIVRIGEANLYLVKRALDIGSQGILVPLVNSPEEAELIVSYAMYPPKGVRGTGPGRASQFGLNFGEYVRKSNENLLIAVQIETKDGLANLKSILETKGVDIGFAGPSDLTMSLGLLDDRSNPKVLEAMSKVVKSCEDTGKIPGTLAVSIDEAKKFKEMGFKFISLASDSRFLISVAKSFIETLNFKQAAVG